MEISEEPPYPICLNLYYNVKLIKKFYQKRQDNPFLMLQRRIYGVAYPMLDVILFESTVLQSTAATLFTNII
jgi:hypothetical protein